SHLFLIRSFEEPLEVGLPVFTLDESVEFLGKPPKFSLEIFDEMHLHLRVKLFGEFEIELFRHKKRALQLFSYWSDVIEKVNVRAGIQGCKVHSSSFCQFIFESKVYS